MQVKNMLNKSVLAMTALTMAACSGGGGDGGKLEDVAGDISGYVEASCLHQYTEGSNALVKSASKNVRNTYFGKNIDMSLLKPVLGASGSEVVRFAETTNVRFYKTTTYKSGSCEFLASLPEATSDLQSTFSRMDSGGSILGLYLAANSPDLPRKSLGASVIVRRDANKWVLVHEFMHHLFQLQVDAENPSSEDSKSEFLRIYKEYESAKDSARYASSGRKEKALAAAVKLKALNKVGLSLMREYFLEEMTIESVMGEKLDSGELKLVLSKQRINGAAYTISSSKKAEDFLQSLETETSTFRMTYMYDIIGTSEYNDLSSSTGAFSSVKSDISTLRSRAKSYLSSLGYEYNGLTKGLISEDGHDEETAHEGCSHGELPTEILEAVSKMGKPTL